MHYYLFGGQERVLLSEIEWLRSQGHEIAVFAVDNPQTCKDNVRKYLLDTDDIFKARQKGLRPKLTTKLKYFFSGIYNRKSAKAFEHAIHDFHPDIIHSHGPSRYFTSSIFHVAKGHNLPVIFSEHCVRLACPSYYFLKGYQTYCKDELCIKGNYVHCVLNRCYEKSLLKSIYYSLELAWNKPRYMECVDYIIAPSQYLRDVLIRTGFDSKKIKLIRNFVDFVPIKPDFHPGEGFVFCGRASQEKGLMSLIKAFARMPDLQLKIIGDGNCLKQLKTVVEQNHLRNITITGFIEGSALTPIIENSKCVILPSLCAENAPIILLEAMACGKPILGSNLGGIPEIITDDTVGKLFKPGDVDSMVSSVRWIESLHKDELTEMGANNRRVIEENYSLDAHGKQITELYNMAIHDCSV
jgi:glycosyltransferase involved in cell wall biosynthesis